MLKSQNIANKLKSLLQGKNNKKYNWQKAPAKNYDYLLYPQTGLLTAGVTKLAQNALTEISFYNKDFNLKEAKKIISKDPTTRGCLETKALYASLQLGEYMHPNPRIQSDINEDLNNMGTSLKEIMGKASSAMPFGFSCMFISFYKKKGQLRLKEIDALDHEYVIFKGSHGAIKFIRYNDLKVQDIPYNNILHIVNGYITNFDDPYGNPELNAAIPYIKAKLAFIGDLVMAGKVAATGIIIGKTSDKLINSYDKDGKTGEPIPATIALLKQLENIDNNSVVVTDVENDISSLNINNGLGNFYLPVLNQLDDYIRQSFHVPKTILHEGSNPNAQTATLAQKHHTIFSATISAVVNQFKDEFINKICKPIILHNYSFNEHKGNYGEFRITPDADADTEQKNLSNILQAIQIGILDPYDLEVQNRVRKILGLPEKTLSEIANTQMRANKLKMALQSALQPMENETNEEERPVKEPGN
jgi:hypothetical protein